MLRNEQVIAALRAGVQTEAVRTFQSSEGSTEEVFASQSLSTVDAGHVVVGSTLSHLPALRTKLQWIASGASVNETTETEKALHVAPPTVRARQPPKGNTLGGERLVAMPPCVALKSSAALSGERALATLVPALPRARPELTPVLGGTGTWVGTGICDLRASVVSQQKQLDSLIDRVALLLSSMHSEVLQDVRAAVASPDFEARLGEMTKVGEILDQRLAELRAEAQEVPEGVRMLQEELSRVEEPGR
eukprot:Skav217882  [mRNA]  locus=scaffold67:54424:60758:+ [translate_table: standard]